MITPIPAFLSPSAGITVRQHVMAAATANIIEQMPIRMTAVLLNKVHLDSDQSLVPAHLLKRMEMKPRLGWLWELQPGDAKHSATCEANGHT